MAGRWRLPPRAPFYLHETISVNATTLAGGFSLRRLGSSYNRRRYLPWFLLTSPIQGRGFVSRSHVVTIQNLSSLSTAPYRQELIGGDVQLQAPFGSVRAFAR